MQNEDHPEEAQRSKNAKLARQVEANDMKWLMSTKQGRRLMHRLVAEAGVYRISFTGNSETFFKEGKRAFGLFLLGEIQAHAPDSYIEMLTEAKAGT